MIRAMKHSRSLVVLALAVLAACSPKPLDKAAATRLVNEHASFAAPVDKLPLAADIVQTPPGIDAGVVEGVWKYSARDASGRPERVLTEKGKQAFKDANGSLAAPAKRQVVDLDIVEDKSNAKHRGADFTWRYDMPALAQRYTGYEGTYHGHAELQYDGAWKVQSVTADAKPGTFLWTAELGKEVYRMLSAEQDATTQRTLALEPQRFTTPDKKPYSITVADVYVSVDEETARHTVNFLEYRDCAVEEAGSNVTFKLDGLRQTLAVPAAAGAKAELEKICGIVKEAYQSWMSRNAEVAARGPLGVAYSR
jgi:hypothetical protein